MFYFACGAAVRPPKFAPHRPQSLVLPSGGANSPARKAPCVRPSLRPAAAKPCSTVGRRKQAGEKSAVRPPKFAPRRWESLNPPSAGANSPARKAPDVRPSLRLAAGKALIHRREAQTVRREKRRTSAQVCASPPAKPCSTGGRRKQVGEKSAVRPPKFAPRRWESLNPPSAGANSPARKAPCVRPSLRPAARKALFYRREAQTGRREKHRASAQVCAPPPGKP